MSWWPFWRSDRRLQRLTDEADANPKDAAKQSALLHELNKFTPGDVIKRFEQRSHAVDSRGVAEYLRALVLTNSIADYLPDEQSGRPASLPALLQELKQRLSRNEDKPFMKPGISEKQPLHVVMFKALGEEIGIGFLGIGFQPKWALSDIPKMPKLPEEKKLDLLKTIASSSPYAQEIHAWQKVEEINYSYVEILAVHLSPFGL